MSTLLGIGSYGTSFEIECSSGMPMERPPIGPTERPAKKVPKGSMVTHHIERRVLTTTRGAYIKSGTFRTNESNPVLFSDLPY